MITFICWVLAYIAADSAYKARGSRGRAIGLAVTAIVLCAVSVLVLPNMLYLGKVAGRLAMPLGIVWMALLGFAAVAWSRRQKGRVAVASGCFILVSVLGNAPLGNAMLAWLESDYVARDVFDGEPLDAIFVLGGSTSPSVAGARLADSGDRLLTAARVFKRRSVGKVVTSGSSIPGINGETRDVAREAAEILVDMGVTPEAIIEIPAPVNSSQEVTAYKAMATAESWGRVGVVTSAWHMRRVERLYRAAGLDAEPIPADFRGEVHWNGLLSLIPEGSGFQNIQRASWELLGAAVGR